MSAAAAAVTRPAQRPPRDTTINLRIQSQTRDLIDAAATATGKTRTEFVVDSARQHAIDVLLDQRFFTLDADQSRNFFDIIDSPPEPNTKLKELMKRKPSWEK